MSGSGNSNLGYGNIIPNSNVNASYVNVSNSNYAGGFSSNEIPQSSLLAAKNNIDAANSCVPGACYKGGMKKRKTIKRKIKNIYKMYNMKKGRHSRRFKNRVKSMKSKIRSRYGGRKMKSTRKNHTRKRGRTYRMRGGYSQYQNNYPLTPVYSVGANLSSSQSALANPPPINVLGNCANCTDNYNHFTGKGFASAGN